MVREQDLIMGIGGHIKIPSTNYFLDPEKTKKTLAN